MAHRPVMKVMTVSENMVGTSVGKTTFQRTLKGFAPMLRAASTVLKSMPRMALRRKSAWLLVQAKVMVKSTALKPENQFGSKLGKALTSAVVRMPSEA